jgi:VCBS repeat-containing protein
LTLSTTMAFSDRDLTDTHKVTFTVLGIGYIGDFTPMVATDSTNGAQGSVSITYHLTIEQVMAASGHIPDHQDYLVTIDDQHGGTSSQIVSIPLAQILSSIDSGGAGGGGNNTNPVIFIDALAHDSAAGLVFDDSDHPDRQHLIERLSFSDAEVNQSHNVTQPVGIDAGPLGTLGAMFVSILRDTDGTVINPVPDPDGLLAASSTGGVLKWDYQVDESKIQWFGQGETYTDTFQFTLMDDHGGTTTQQIAVTILGQNDLPTLGGDAQGVLSQDFDLSPVPPAPNIEQTHAFTFIDPDRTDKHTVRVEFDSGSSTISNSAGTLTAEVTNDTYVDGPHDVTGQIRWTYHLNQAPGTEGRTNLGHHHR